MINQPYLFYIALSTIYPRLPNTSNLIYHIDHSNTSDSTPTHSLTITHPSSTDNYNSKTTSIH